MMQVLLLIVIFFAAFFFRLHGTPLHFVAQDEMLSWYELVAPNFYNYTHPPFPIWIYKFTTGFMEQSFFSLRAIGCFLGALAVISIYFFAQVVTNNKKIALFSALLFLVLPIPVYYSRMIRPYTQLILTTIFLYYTFWQWYTSEKKKYFYIWLLLVALLCFTHQLAYFILFSIFIFCLWDMKWFHIPRKTIFKILSTTAAMVILGSSWIFLDKYFLEGTNFELINPIFYLANAFNFLGPSIDTFFTAEEIVNSFTLGGFGFGILIFVGFFSRYGTHKSQAKFLFCITFIPVIILYFSLGAKSSWEWSRYMCYSSIGASILAINGISFLHSKFQKIGLSLGGIILLLSLYPGLKHIFVDFVADRNHWVNIIVDSQKHVRKVDAVVLNMRIFDYRPFISHNLPVYMYIPWKKKMYFKLKFHPDWYVEYTEPTAEIPPGDYLYMYYFNAKKIKLDRPRADLSIFEEN